MPRWNLPKLAVIKSKTKLSRTTLKCNQISQIKIIYFYQIQTWSTYGSRTIKIIFQPPLPFFLKLHKNGRYKNKMEVQKKITTSEKLRSRGYHNITVLGFDDDGEEIVLVTPEGRADQTRTQMQKNDICRHYENYNNMKQRLRNKLAQKRATQ